MDRREFVRRAAAGLGGLLVASTVDSPLSAESVRIARRPLGADSPAPLGHNRS